MTRLTGIRHTIESKRKIAAPDLRFVVDVAREPVPLARPEGYRVMMRKQGAVVVLEEAVRCGVYPRSQFAPLITREAIRADRLMAGVYASDYNFALALPGPVQKGLLPEMFAVRHTHTDPSTIDREERAFLSKCLASNSTSERSLAGEYLVGKSGLDQAALAYAQQIVAGQIRSPDANVRLYWEFVRDVVTARNRRRGR